MKKLFLLVVNIIAFLANSSAQSFSTRIVKDSLFIPWEIIYGPDNNIWFTQKNGYICKLVPATGHTDTIYHETNTVILGTGEGGMLGMAMHPQFPTQPYLYVVYEYLSGPDYRERIVRYTYNNGTLQSPLTLLDLIHGATYHNGCRLLIVGDKLFITTGDATVGSNAQDVNVINGKILRINLDGSIPSDNPIAGSPIWTWGHRNPQGLIYANNMLYSSEHGNATDDEINIIVKGRNYGWPTVEGFCDQPAEIIFCNDSNVKQPIYAWTPTIAPSGMDYYNLPMFPSLQKSLILTTLKDVHLYQLKLKNNLSEIDSAKIITAVNYGRLRDVCFSPEGRIYISTSNSPAGGIGVKIDKIIELYDPTFTSIPKGEEKIVVQVYPNPVKDELFIATTGAGMDETWKYYVTDIRGCMMQSGSFKLPVTINTSLFAAGMYFLKCVDEARNMQTVKFIRE